MKDDAVLTKSDKSNGTKPLAKHAWMALFAILALSLVYHALTIDQQSFFVDETFEVAHARETVNEIVHKPDSTPPAFALFLKVWLSAFGSDASARWFSVACSLVSIILVHELARKAISERAGLFSAAIFAALPLQLYYAQFVRSYGLFLLLVATSLYFFWHATHSSEIRKTHRYAYWAGFVICSVLGIFVHYFFSIFLATMFLITLGMLAATRRTRPELLRQSALAFAAIAILASPSILLLKDDLASQKSLDNYRPFSIQAAGYTGLTFFSGYSLGPSKVELHTMSGQEAIKSALPWTVGLLAFSLPLGIGGFRSLQELRLSLAVITLLLLPMLLIGLIGQVVGLTYHPRFVAWCLLPLAILLGAGADSLWQRRSTRGLASVCLVGLAVIAGCALWNRNLNARYKNEDLRSVAAYLAQQAKPALEGSRDAAEASPCFVLSDYLAHTLRYYSQGATDFVKLPNPDGSGEAVRDSKDLQLALSAIKRRQAGSNNFWLLYSRPFHGDPEGLLLEQLKASHALQKEAEFAGATLYRGQQITDR